MSKFIYSCDVFLENTRNKEYVLTCIRTVFWMSESSLLPIIVIIKIGFK